MDYEFRYPYIFWIEDGECEEELEDINNLRGAESPINYSSEYWYRYHTL